MPLYNLHVDYTFNLINASNAANTVSWFVATVQFMCVNLSGHIFKHSLVQNK